MEFKKSQFLLFLTIVFIGFAASLNLFAQESDELFKKVMRNDIEGIKELLASGADINQQNKMYGHTPLMEYGTYMKV